MSLLAAKLCKFYIQMLQIVLPMRGLIIGKIDHNIYEILLWSNCF